MDTSDLRRSEIVGIVAGLVLVASLFIEWFTLGTGPDVVRESAGTWVCGTGENSCTGFDTFPILRWLLIAAAAAPLILTWLVVRGHETTWPRGEMTAVVGLTALVLIGYNGIIDRPSEADIQVSLSIGYFVAVAAAFAIFLSGGFRAVESGGGANRKPPATY